jgi:hypothetical protein
VTLTVYDEQRFWSKVDKRGHDECWPWTGSKFATTGYGQFWLRGTNVGAHRVACALTHGLSAGRMAIHSCDNPPCCNPLHLRWGTHAENVADRVARGRTPRGEDHKRSKLSDATVGAARAARLDGRSISALASDFGVSRTTLRDALNGRTWRHV